MQDSFTSIIKAFLAFIACLGFAVSFIGVMLHLMPLLTGLVSMTGFVMFIVLSTSDL
jgi:hypothetical protein